jgi:hypothetical protein
MEHKALSPPPLSAGGTSHPPYFKDRFALSKFMLIGFEQVFFYNTPLSPNEKVA